MSWAKVGDFVHVASLLDVILFSATVAFRPSVLDSVWLENGFCVANADVTFWTSHDLCLYADFFLGAVLTVTYLLLRNEPGMAAANEFCHLTATLGIIGHGIGHGAIAARLRQDPELSDSGNEPTYESWGILSSPAVDVLQRTVPLTVFWVLLMKSAMTRASWYTVALATTSSAFLGLFIPANFGFTYVQLILFLVFDYNELSKSTQDKGFEYMLYALMVSFPIGVVGWIESTLCSKGVMGIGGHLIYDAYIPLSMLAFYMICWLRTIAKNTPSTDGKLKKG